MMFIKAVDIMTEKGKLGNKWDDRDQVSSPGQC